MALDLILKDISDKYIRENFFRLKKFLGGQVLFDGSFKFFDIEIDEINLSFKIPHGFTFIPLDIIRLSVTGNANVTFLYDDFDRDNIYVATAGPCRLRFLAGRIDD